jgi:hydrogenase large subunit
MAEKILVNVPLNRVEGDLEIRAEIENGHVTDAWSSGTMYRGFERMMIGRGALDGLVITPRVCGICGTSHLTTAAQALEMVANIKPPANAIRLRNLALMVEHVQNNLRQTFLMFTTDFTNPAYRNNPLYAEALRRYEAFKGESVLEVIKSTKRLLESVAIIGGQWPHSSYMVPGGIASIPSTSDLLQCRMILGEFRNWFERRILGCSLQRWLEIRSADDLESWLEECDSHRESDLGFFLRFSRDIGLETIGQGYKNFLSYGAFELPQHSAVQSLECITENSQTRSPFLIPAGFAQEN